MAGSNRDGPVGRDRVVICLHHPDARTPVTACIQGEVRQAELCLLCGGIVEAEPFVPFWVRLLKGLRGER